MFFTRYVLNKSNLLCSRKQLHILCQKVFIAEPKPLALNSVRYISSSDQKNLSSRQKFKNAIKDYGATVIVFHVTIALISLGGFYLAVYSGLDMVRILQTVGITLDDQSSLVAGRASTFVVAYAIHKVFAPVRISITLVSVPFIVRYLRRIGFMKTPVKK